MYSCIYFVNKTFVASNWGGLDCRAGQVAVGTAFYRVIVRCNYGTSQQKLSRKCNFFIQVTANRKPEGQPQAGTNTGHPSPTEHGEVVLHPFPIKVGPLLTLLQHRGAEPHLP